MNQIQQTKTDERNVIAVNGEIDTNWVNCRNGTDIIIWYAHLVRILLKRCRTWGISLNVFVCFLIKYPELCQLDTRY